MIKNEKFYYDSFHFSNSINSNLDIRYYSIFFGIDDEKDHCDHIANYINFIHCCGNSQTD
jgi:hypothetical protein